MKTRIKVRLINSHSKLPQPPGNPEEYKKKKMDGLMDREWKLGLTEIFFELWKQTKMNFFLKMQRLVIR